MRCSSWQSSHWCYTSKGFCFCNYNYSLLPRALINETDTEPLICVNLLITQSSTHSLQLYGEGLIPALFSNHLPCCLTHDRVIHLQYCTHLRCAHTTDIISKVCLLIEIKLRSRFPDFSYTSWWICEYVHSLFLCFGYGSIFTIHLTHKDFFKSLC